MNEDQVLELFAPARDREMPAARFTMTDVYDADARLCRRRRAAAVVATVAVVAGIVSMFALAGSGGRRSLPPIATPSATASQLPSLTAVLDQLVLPPGSARAPLTGATQLGSRSGTGSPTTMYETRYWTSPVSRQSTIAWLSAHLPFGWTLTIEGTSADGTSIGSWSLPADPAADGPNLNLSIKDLATGSGVLVSADETPRPAKTAADLVAGDVESADGTFSEAVGHPHTATVTGAAADQLAKDINNLRVVATPRIHECGVPPRPDVTLTFHTSTGNIAFEDFCGLVRPLPVDQGTPVLDPSDALELDLRAAFAAPPPADLEALIRQVTVAGLAEVPLPADGQVPGAYGYSNQPGYQRDVRYWTSTQSPAAVIASMTVHPPAGMTGRIMPPMPNKGPADAQASYRAADSASRIGPRLELYAVALSDGRTAVSAIAWQIRTAAKPAALLVTGDVLSVTGTYAEAGQESATDSINGEKARQLAADFNGLLVNTAGTVPCTVGSASLDLTFHTPARDITVRDVCGYVTVGGSGKQDLWTSNAFNIDVNRAFVGLMPAPLPSSAPLPVG